MNNTHLQILNDILNSISSDKILVVGIDGKGCSGKSYLARLLHKALRELAVNSVYLSIDDFCNKRKIRYDSSIYEEGHLVYYNNFDDEAFEGILATVAKNQSISYHKNHLDVKTDSFTNLISFHLESGGVLLVEGLHLFKERFASYFDIKIIVSITDAEQLRRALVRDIDRGNGKEMILYKYKNRFGPSHELYLSKDNPFDKSDYIIDNNNMNNPFFIRQRT